MKNSIFLECLGPEVRVVITNEARDLLSQLGSQTSDLTMTQWFFECLKSKVGVSLKHCFPKSVAEQSRYQSTASERFVALIAQGEACHSILLQGVNIQYPWLWLYEDPSDILADIYPFEDFEEKHFIKYTQQAKEIMLARHEGRDPVFAPLTMYDFSNYVVRDFVDYMETLVKDHNRWIEKMATYPFPHQEKVTGYLEALLLAFNKRTGDASLLNFVIKPLDLNRAWVEPINGSEVRMTDGITRYHFNCETGCCYYGFAPHLFQDSSKG